MSRSAMSRSASVGGVLNENAKSVDDGPIDLPNVAIDRGEIFARVARQIMGVVGRQVGRQILRGAPRERQERTSIGLGIFPSP